jgi:predicted metal-dependent HD superfamily phosphohydrolase
MKLDRFNELWNRCAGFPDSTGTKVFHLLEDLYHTPNRFYHTSAHIDQCLKSMDQASVELGSSDVVELSIWFHDAIYDPGAPDNELRSAEYFSDHAADRLPRETISEVTRCILSTTHRSLPKDKYSEFVVDVDLSGFGQDWEGFRSDGENVRKENDHLSMELYIQGQTKFMKKLLDRERIFSTAYFNSRYESIARNNIEKQLKLYYQGLI